MLQIFCRCFYFTCSHGVISQIHLPFDKETNCNVGKQHVFHGESVNWNNTMHHSANTYWLLLIQVHK